jgi:Flp pilus assembly CpaE family ATPase
MEDTSQVEVLLARLDDLMPGFLVVAFGGHLEPDVMRKLMHMGIREYLPSPIKPAELTEAVDSVKRYLKRHPAPVAGLADFYTFLPAKPGVGTSTIAASTSCALANELGAHTLLLDCDLDAGTIKFLLKLGNTASLVDAIDHANKLDEDLLSQMVGKWENLDVLHAGGLIPPPSIDLPSLQRFLALARSQYEVVCADLASSLGPFSVNLMRESSRIFLVTTPEVVPLHFARQRMRRLDELGLSDQVRLLVNRKPGAIANLDDEKVAEMVGIPVSYSFPNDYPTVQSSILGSGPVSHVSDLGESILALARSLTTHPGSKEPRFRRRFLEFFRVPKVEDPDVVWRH